VAERWLRPFPNELLSVLQANPVAPEFLLERASLFLESALASGALSVEEAKELLETLHWPELGAEEIGFAVRALELALIALSTGSATVTEVLNRLSQAVAEGVLGPLASETKALSGLPGLASSLLKLGCALEPRALESDRNFGRSGSAPWASSATPYGSLLKPVLTLPRSPPLCPNSLRRAGTRFGNT
jgi:hypothetical protein